MAGLNVAVVGATGAVGQQMLKILEERSFPIKEIKLLASKRSAGVKINFMNRECTVEETVPDSFKGVDIALFSAGTEISKIFAPEAVKRGVVVIDNSNAFRMDPDVPLVVPEVNPHALHKHKGLISNPNCSTIQMVVALKPIHDCFKIKRVVVSTYQAVSGTGREAIKELTNQSKAILDEQEIKLSVYPHQIAFNTLPHIDVFDEEGYTREERKMMNETVKIMEDNSIKVTATTVRVPVFNAHSESINIQTAKKATVKEIKDLLSRAPGVKVVDDPANLLYPMPILANGKDEVLVGRIREDNSIENGINMWVVADNLRKGAALNAIQIAEYLLNNGLIKVR
ncbi:MAG TPA: aspartate-semialdehyde dehydrogenase [Clostridia bacterium]|nr:aspartate-semialdehyde dehydrogenase [Clostridia bacterium]